MQTCLITFLSQTAAFRFQKIARQNSILIKLVQTPKQISYGGCSYAARCAKRDVSRARALLKQHSISYSRVFFEFLDTNGKTYYESL